MVKNDATSEGNFTVGTQQQPADTTLNGNLEVRDQFSVIDKLKVTSSEINCSLPVNCEQGFQVNNNTTLIKDVTMGTTQAPILATVNGDANVSGKLSVDGLTSLQSELSVQDKAIFVARTFHQNGVAVSSAGQSFCGMIKQNNRIEFFLDGTLRFYVDSTGGHNA